MLTKPLQKIASGMFVIASSFVIATVVEIVLEKTYPAVPGEGGVNMLSARLAFHNALPENCNLALSVIKKGDETEDPWIFDIQGESAFMCKSNPTKSLILSFSGLTLSLICCAPKISNVKRLCVLFIQCCT